METQTGLAVMIALGFVQRFLYGFDHRWVLARRESLVRSVTASRPPSDRDQWLTVDSGWYTAFWGAVGAQFFLLVAWLIAADTVTQQTLKLFAYLLAFFTAIGIASLAFEGTMAYRSYRRLLRSS